MVHIVATASLFGLFSIVGFGLAMLVSTFKCSKTNAWTSVKEGMIWASLPVLVYTLVDSFSFLQTEFANGIKQCFSWTGAVTDESGYNTVGIAYAVILAGLIMTTRMVHAVEVAVCVPSTAELATFQKDLMKELKQKEADKKHF